MRYSSTRSLTFLPWNTLPQTSLSNKVDSWALAWSVQFLRTMTHCFLPWMRLILLAVTCMQWKQVGLQSIAPAVQHIGWGETILGDFCTHRAVIFTLQGKDTSHQACWQTGIDKVLWSLGCCVWGDQKAIWQRGIEDYHRHGKANVLTWTVWIHHTHLQKQSNPDKERLVVLLKTLPDIIKQYGTTCCLPSKVISIRTLWCSQFWWWYAVPLTSPRFTAALPHLSCHHHYTLPKGHFLPSKGSRYISKQQWTNRILTFVILPREHTDVSNLSQIAWAFCQWKTDEFSTWYYYLLLDLHSDSSSSLL